MPFEKTQLDEAIAPVSGEWIYVIPVTWYKFMPFLFLPTFFHLFLIFFFVPSSPFFAFSLPVVFIFILHRLIVKPKGIAPVVG